MSEEEDAPRVSVARIFLAFLKLGLTSFGGPVAHLGYFRRDIVARRGWISESDYAQMVALCQFLPGPASSQTGFAIGLKLGGVAGGLAAFVGFTLPSAVLMLAAAWGASLLGDGRGAALVHGLKLVAVSIVAHAVIVMARAHCRSMATIVLAALALAFLIAVPHPLAAPALILVAAISGVLVRAPVTPQHVDERFQPGTVRSAMLVFAVFLVLLAGLPLLRGASDSALIALADGFYRSGALIFGGGHVMLPLLQAETAGVVSDEAFLAGYGAAQALPGPLSAFAAYLGAIAGATGPQPSIVAGLTAMTFIFLPGFLLVAAALPLWSRLRALPRAAGAVRHANAAVVGVLAAAWWSPVVSSGVLTHADAFMAAMGVGALFVPRLPVLAVVVLVAGTGAAAYGVGAV